MRSKDQREVRETRDRNHRESQEMEDDGYETQNKKQKMNRKMRETEMRLKIRARKLRWLLEADGSLVYLELTALPPTQKHHLQAACSPHWAPT